MTIKKTINISLDPLFKKKGTMEINKLTTTKLSLETPNKNGDKASLRNGKEYADAITNESSDHLCIYSSRSEKSEGE